MNPKKKYDDSIEADDNAPNIEGLDSQEGDLSWDKKAQKLMRQIVTQKVDLPISRLRQMIDDGEINLAPGFQRRLRWTKAQKSRLIESIMMNVPIPPVFLGEQKPGQYVVLDGRQRLTAIYEYLSGDYSLSGLHVLDDLNRKKFVSLKKIGEPPISSSITRRFVPAILILHESVPEVKYEVFDRLNTGGVIAEPMEVRNAIYSGEFRELLHELSDNDTFRTLWGIPVNDKQRENSGTYRKMVDLEMVLRFFAFQNYTAFSGKVKNFLNEYMSSRNKEYEQCPELKEADRQLFIDTINKTYKIFGEKALHRIDLKGNQSDFTSAPLADGLLFAVSKLPNRDYSEEEVKLMQETLKTLCMEDKEFVKSITTGTNAKSSAQYRVETVNKELQKVIC